MFEDEPLTDAEVMMIAEAFGWVFGREVDVLDDPLSAEFVLDDVLDAEIIG